MEIKEYFKYDFKSAVVVFLVALPLCLGIALASGAPLFSGIITGIVGGIVVGILSKSPLSVSGPAAGLTTIVLAAITDLGYEVFLVAVILAGIIQIIAGFLKAGAIGHFFPASVLKGMLASIGIILILKQIPHAVGYDADFEGDQSFFQNDGQNTLTELMNAWDYLTPGAIVVSIFSVLIMILWGTKALQRYEFFRTVPSALIAVVAGVLLNLLFIQTFPDFIITEKHLVNVPTLKEEGSILAFFTFPDFGQILNQKVWIVAFTLAAVASLETLLNIEASDKIDPFRRITPLNRELKAQGVANVLSGAIGGLPLTSVVVRSSANIQSGARTKASTITHGIILLLSVLLIPRVLQMIPLAALAGILFVTGYKLTKPYLYKDMYQKGWSQFLPFVITVLAVVFTNLLLGVFIGLMVAIFFILKTNFQESVILVNEGNNFLLRLTKDVSFLNKATLRDVFISIPSNSSITIDGSMSHFIDHDVRETIIDFIETSKTKNIQVNLKHIEI